VFVGIGVLFAGLGVAMQRGESRFGARAARAAATVTDVRSRSGGSTSGGVIWVPVVRFTTADGRTVEAETSSGTNRKRHRPGQAIEVLYDPAKPTDVRVPGSGASIVHVAFIALGSAFAAIGLAIAAITVAVS
jgi:hypothetical protein